MSISDLYLMALGPCLALVAGLVIYLIAISDRSHRSEMSAQAEDRLDLAKHEAR